MPSYGFPFLDRQRPSLVTHSIRFDKQKAQHCGSRPAVGHGSLRSLPLTRPRPSWDSPARDLSQAKGEFPTQKRVTKFRLHLLPGLLTTLTPSLLPLPGLSPGQPDGGSFSEFKSPASVLTQTAQILAAPGLHTCAFFVPLKVTWPSFQPWLNPYLSSGKPQARHFITC